MKQADLMAMFKEASKSNCIPTIVLLLDALLPSSPKMTPENTNEDPNDPEPVDGYTNEIIFDNCID